VPTESGVGTAPRGCIKCYIATVGVDDTHFGSQQSPGAEAVISDRRVKRHLVGAIVHDALAQTAGAGTPRAYFGRGLGCGADKSESRRPCVESQSIIMTAVRGNGDGGVGRTATEHAQDTAVGDNAPAPISRNIKQGGAPQPS